MEPATPRQPGNPTRQHPATRQPARAQASLVAPVKFSNPSNPHHRSPASSPTLNDIHRILAGRKPRNPQCIIPPRRSFSQTRSPIGEEQPRRLSGESDPRRQERANHAQQRHDCSELPVRRLARLQRWREVGGRAALAKCGLAHGAASSDEPAIGPAVTQHAKRRQAPQNWRRRRDRRGRRRDHRRSRRAPMLESSSGPSAESPLASSHHQRKVEPQGR